MGGKNKYGVGGRRGEDYNNVWGRRNGRQSNQKTDADAKKDSSSLSEIENSSATAAGKEMKSTKSMQRGKVAYTLINERAILSGGLKPGMGLGSGDIPRNLGLYNSPWNARNYAHKRSTDFSSFKLTESLEKSVGTVNFVSDWENIKKLISSSLSKKSQSFIVHKLGKTIFLDELNLTKLCGSRCFEVSLEWLFNCTKAVIGPHVSQIMKEKTDGEVIGYEAFHKLLYFSIEKGMEFKTKHGVQTVEKNCSEVPQKPKINLPGSQTNFLHKVAWNIDKHSMLVGSNIPLLYRNNGRIGSLTLRTQDSTNSEKIEPLNGLDMWLDNILLDVTETFVVYLKNQVIDKTEWIRTEEFPRRTECNMEKIVAEGMSVFDFLKTRVVNPGNTYWLYKPPGDSKYQIYDLTNLTHSSNDNMESPFLHPFADLLHRTLDTFMKEGKLRTSESILEDALNLFDSNHPSDREVVEAAIKKYVSEMTATTLFDAAVSHMEFFNDKVEYLYEISNRREFCKDLCKAFLLIQSAFDRLKGLKMCHKLAANIALKMPGLFTHLKDTCAFNTHMLETRFTITLSEAFECVSKCLTEAVRLEIENVRPECQHSVEETENTKILKFDDNQSLHDLLMWTLSSITLEHAVYHLDSFPNVIERPSEVNLKSYTRVSYLLSEALKHTENSLKYPTVTEKKQRLAEIRSLAGDVRKNQIYLMIDQQHAKHSNCADRWEPTTPDVIFTHIKKECRALKRRPFAWDWKTGATNLMLDLQTNAIVEFQYASNEAHDPFEAVINFMKYLDVKLFLMSETKSELHTFSNLLLYLRILKEKMEDMKDLSPHHKFDINQRNCPSYSDLWKRTFAKEYLFDTAPFPVLIRIGVRLLHDLREFSTLAEGTRETASMKTLITNLEQLLSPFKEDVRNTNDSDRRVLGLKRYLGFDYRIGTWKQSDFATLLNGLVHIFECLRITVQNLSNDSWVKESKVFIHEDEEARNLCTMLLKQDYQREAVAIYGILSGENIDVAGSAKLHTGGGDADVGSQTNEKKLEDIEAIENVPKPRNKKKKNKNKHSAK